MIRLIITPFFNLYNILKSLYNILYDHLIINYCLNYFKIIILKINKLITYNKL